MTGLEQLDVGGTLGTILNSPVALPAIASAATALGVKWLDSRGTLRKQVHDEATELRTELRQEIDDLRKRLTHEEEEADVWRTKFYEQLAELALFKAKQLDMERVIGDLRRMTGDRRASGGPLEDLGASGGKQ